MNTLNEVKVFKWINHTFAVLNILMPNYARRMKVAFNHFKATLIGFHDEGLFEMSVKFNAIFSMKSITLFT